MSLLSHILLKCWRIIYRLLSLPKGIRERSLACFKAIKTIPQQAKCLSALIQHQQTEPSFSKRLLKYQKPAFIIDHGAEGAFKRAKRQLGAFPPLNRAEPGPTNVKVAKKEYQLSSKFEGLGPLGMVARLLSGATMIRKKEERVVP